MIIKVKVEARNGGMRTVYYKHTSDGRPICGSKNLAADFPRAQAVKILEQLQTIDSRFKEAELVA